MPTDENMVKTGLSFLTVLTTIFSIVSYIFDLGTDIVTIWLLRKEFKLVEFYISLGFLLIPALIINVFSFIWYIQDSTRIGPHQSSVTAWVFRSLCHVLLFGVVCRHIESLYLGIRDNLQCKIRRQKRKNENMRQFYCLRKDTAQLSLMESFLQDAPQFTLQVYIWMQQNNSTRLADTCGSLCSSQMVSIASSMTSLCFSIVSYENVRRSSGSLGAQMSPLAFLYQFLWRMGTTGSRIFILLLAISTFPDFSLGVISLHWVTFTILFILQEPTSFSDLKLHPHVHTTLEYTHTAVLGVIHIFCFIDFTGNPRPDQMGTFYTLAIIEENLFLCFWYWKISNVTSPDFRPWLYSMVAFIYYTAFFTGIFALVLYNKTIHGWPRNSERDRREDQLLETNALPPNSNDAPLKEIKTNDGINYCESE